MLTAEYVHLIRTSGKSDGHWSRILKVTRGAIYAARTGLTWSDHETPPDRRPRKHGRRGGELAVLNPVPALDVGRLISGMAAPPSDDSTAEHT